MGGLEVLFLCCAMLGADFVGSGVSPAESKWWAFGGLRCLGSISLLFGRCSILPRVVLGVRCDSGWYFTVDSSKQGRSGCVLFRVVSHCDLVGCTFGLILPR